MDRTRIWVVSVFIILILPLSSSEEANVKQSLVQFMSKLAVTDLPVDGSWGWNLTSDPCSDKWIGVSCYPQTQTVKKIVLEGLNLAGTFDAASVCTAKSLAVLSLKENRIVGSVPKEIGNCRSLTHLYLSGNQFLGQIPESVSKLSNLNRLEISDNDFSGQVPDLSLVSGLLSFFAQNNLLSGVLPGFFSNLQELNVSNNNFSGQIPDVKDKFGANSFVGNPGLCGHPLPNSCPSEPTHSSKNSIFIYSGYLVLILLVVILLFFVFVKKMKATIGRVDAIDEATLPNSNGKLHGKSPDALTADNRIDNDKSEYSIISAEGAAASLSLVVLKRPDAMKELTFEDLLQAPAELLGRGKLGTLYKVMLSNGSFLTVKRITDWGITGDDFKLRMQAISQAKHPRVLSPVAFYCSKHEKLSVYEFQANGSLYKVLHDSQKAQLFDWGSRLNVAANIAEALAFMHENLSEDEISHGNLKSSNILFNNSMEACISAYGLKVVQKQDQSVLSHTNSLKNKTLNKGQKSKPFKHDVYCFGVILLELLTGKLVQDAEFDLAVWVRAAVREEWTIEIFDKNLISEAASEERMVNLLQVALKCIMPSPIDRPTMSQIAQTINDLKDEEDRSIISEP